MKNLDLETRKGISVNVLTWNLAAAHGNFLFSSTLNTGSLLFLLNGCWLAGSPSDLLRAIQTRAFRDGATQFRSLNCKSITAAGKITIWSVVFAVRLKSVETCDWLAGKPRLMRALECLKQTRGPKPLKESLWLQTESLQWCSKMQKMFSLFFCMPHWQTHNAAPRAG